MSCEQYKQLMTDKLAGECPPDKEAFLNNHLATCPDCKREFEQLSQAWQLTGFSLKAEPFVETLSPEQHQALHDATQNGRRHKTTQEQLHDINPERFKTPSIPWYMKFSRMELAAGIILFIVFIGLLLPKTGIFKKQTHYRSLADIPHPKMVLAEKSAHQKTAQQERHAAKSLVLEAEENLDDQADSLEVGHEEAVSITAEDSAPKQLKTPVPVLAANNQLSKNEKPPERKRIIASKQDKETSFLSAAIKGKGTVGALKAKKAASPSTEFTKLAQALKRYADTHNGNYPSLDGPAGLALLAGPEAPRFKTEKSADLTKVAAKDSQGKFLYFGGHNRHKSPANTVLLIELPSANQTFSRVLYCDGSIKTLPKANINKLLDKNQ